MNDEIKNEVEEVENTEATEEVVTEETVEGSAEEATDNIFAKGDSPEFKWYVAHALSNHEHKVVRALRERIINHDLTEMFADILVPTETVVSYVNGKKRTRNRNLFPGYVLVKMIMTDETWHLVKNTDKITGFIGGVQGKPSPLSDEDAAYMTNQRDEGFKATKATCNFNEGDSVKVIEGPFASFVGTVEQINEKGKIKVQVSIFGRPTPVELEFNQVEKV